MRYSAALLAIILVTISACEINRLRSAEEHFGQKRYAAAIQESDEFIPKANNGALRTRAELVRSNSYYQLGLIAVQRNSIDLAIRFFKLSNSSQADFELAKIYKSRLLEAATVGDFETQLLYLNSILREIPTSDLVPEMINRRIVIYLDQIGDTDAAWQDYMNLFDTYPGNSYEVAARKSMERIVPNKVAYGRRLADAGYFNEALAVYFELAKYPIIETDEINQLIGATYRGHAEQYLDQENYLEADRFLRIALQYIPEQRPQIEERLRQIVGLFIQKGDNYLAQRDFESALAHYQRVFEIIPDYAPARQAIERLRTTQENIAKAAQLFRQAELAEASGKVGDALKLYQQANSLDGTPETRNRIAIMQNTIEADRNPQAFARKIVNEYRNGLLNNRINQQIKQLLGRYKKSEIRDSGWKFLLSTGQYKYEARYDLMTPQETFLYVWQVSLKDRKIIPLNKISEDLLK
ncbi:MAG TPA: hypothetical protein PKX36_01840 [Candidatus Cloacimonadota bacterium]|nr:hypothetical protein [Candidatus Cloacimonadota bacterium]